MESSSSDETFIWGSASSSSEDSDPIMDKTVSETKREEESESGKSYKSKLQKRLFRASGSADDSDGYLERRVKEEDGSARTPRRDIKKKKRKRDDSIDERCNTTNEKHIKRESANHNKHIKDKHELNDSRVDLNNGNNRIVLEDKFSAEEAVVEMRQARNKSGDPTNFNLKPAKSNKKQIESSSAYQSKEWITDDSSDERSKPIAKNKSTSSRAVGNESVLVNGHRARSDTSTEVKGANEALSSTRRLSERIRFEDDVDSQELMSNSHSDALAISGLFKRFIKVNPNLQTPSLQPQRQVKIMQNDEIWALKCPHEVDVVSFKGIELSLENKSKIKIDGQTYIGNMVTEDSKVAVLMPFASQQYLINNIPLHGSIIFRKRIPKPHIIESNEMTNNPSESIPLPGTRRRHPLFGPDYRRVLRLPPAVRARLHPAALAISPGTTYTKRKKNKRKSEQTEPEERGHAEGRKRRTSGWKEEAPSRKKRREGAPAQAWDSERAIEENLFNF